MKGLRWLAVLPSAGGVVLCTALLAQSSPALAAQVSELGPREHTAALLAGPSAWRTTTTDPLHQQFQLVRKVRAIEEARQDARQEAALDRRQAAAALAARLAAQAAARAAWKRQHAATAQPAPSSQPAPVPSGIYSYAQLEALWVSAGGPSWAEAQAAQIAECESGGNPDAYNPSGATGLWQILGQVVAGNLTNPMVNALNAVFKFKESGDTFAQWVCQ